MGKNRALACVMKLQELNSAVTVSTLSGSLSIEQLSNFQVCCPITRASDGLFLCFQWPSTLKCKYSLFLSLAIVSF